MKRPYSGVCKRSGEEKYLERGNLRLFEGKSKLLAGKTHSGGVDDGHQLLSVLGQQLVEQLLVSLQQLDLSRQMKSVTVLGEISAHHVHVLIEGVG